jgi:hypothetical protein
MVFDVPTGVTAVSFIGVAVPIALTLSIVTRRAKRFVTAVSLGPITQGRQSKDTCDHDVATPLRGFIGYLLRGPRS